LHWRTADAEHENLERMIAGFQSGAHPGVAFVQALHSGPGAAKHSPDDYNGLQANQWFVLNAAMMLMTNLWTEAGLTNGLVGVLIALLCEHDPWESPDGAVALLKVPRSKISTSLLPDCWPEKSAEDSPEWGRAPCEHCKGFDLPEHERAHACWERAGSDRVGNRIGKRWEDHATRYVVVPIACVTRDMQNSNCSRSTLPLVLSFALTIDKSQGMTIRRVLLNPGPTERSVGLFFTGLSRVSNATDIAIVGALNLDRLQRVRKNNRLQARRAWEAATFPPLEAALDAFVRTHTPTMPGGQDWQGRMPAFCAQYFGQYNCSPRARK
jgi:hypothetical protein